MKLETLRESECMTLIKDCDVGRIGVIHDGKPVILPVNYVVDAGTVVLRVEEGSIIAEASMTSAAFEVDAIDSASHHGWSVLIQGHAHDVTTTIDEHSEKLRRLMVQPWAPGEKSRWMAIEPRHVTGRRLG